MLKRIELWRIQWQTYRRNRRLRRQWRQGVRQVHLVNLPLAVMLRRWQSNSEATKAAAPAKTAWCQAALRRLRQIVTAMLPASAMNALAQARSWLSARLRPRLQRLQAARTRALRRLVLRLLTLGILAWLRRSSSR